jgi:signal transduction histidine kinase
MGGTTTSERAGYGPWPGTGAAGEVDRWDRSWFRLQRWVPLTLLAVATTLSVVSPEQPAAQRPGTVLLAALTAGWLILAHRLMFPRAALVSAPPERASHALLHLVVVLSLATALMARDVVFFIFAISGFLYAAWLRPTPLVFVGTGTTSLAIMLFTWEGVPSDFGELVAFVSIVVIQTFLIGLGVVGGEKVSVLSEERRTTVQQLEASLAENEGLQAQLVAHAREAGVHDERRRLAREIHDTLAQGLTGVIMQLEAAEQGAEHPATVRRHLGAAAELARTSLAEARRSVHALAPEALTQGRLADALQELVTGWSERTGLPATATVTGPLRPCAVAVEVALLRVAQEALANVAKHADARRAGVTLSQLDDRVVLDVRDDGHGFDPSAVDPGASFGLRAMRQRVEELGGELAVETHLGRGTAVSATIPVTAGEELDGG